MTSAEFKLIGKSPKSGDFLSCHKKMVRFFDSDIASHSKSSEIQRNLNKPLDPISNAISELGNDRWKLENNGNDVVVMWRS